MSLHTRSGTRVTSANLATVTDDVTPADPWVLITEDLVERGEFSGGSDAAVDTDDDKVQQKFRQGEVVRQSEVLATLTPASVDTLTPNDALATAGGTVIEVDGDGLDGVTAVTVGGTAATAVTVDDPRNMHFITPAKAAGTYDVVFTDDAGAVTKTGALTFA